MAIPTFLEQLLTAVGPSGHETGPAAVWRKACEGFADEVGGDHVGSSFARVKGKAGGPTLALVGHIDEIDAAPFELRHRRVVSRAMDNRVGCYVVAEAARLVAEAGGAPGDVVALAVAQEETTFAGARTSTFALRPDLAVVVDLTF